MSGQEDKNQNAKSKIEQIKEELKKKLAAIEKSDSTQETSINEKEKSIELNSKESDTNLVFEISEGIEDAISNVETEVESTEAKVKKQVSNVNTIEKIIKNESSFSKNEDSNTKKTIIPPPKSVATAIHVNQQEWTKAKTVIAKEKEVAYVEEKPKKKSNYLLYLLLLLLFAGIAYMLVNYLNQNKEHQKIIMDQKLSEFKNKIYLDSIELADLNNQLMDLQSKKLIDSIDQVNEKKLLDNSKIKNITEVKRNFSVDGNEIVKKSKRNNAKNNWSTPTNNQAIVDNNKTIIGNMSSNKEASVPFNESNANVKSVENKQTGDERTNNEGSKMNETTSENSKDEVITQSNELPKEIEKDIPKVVKAPVFPGCEKKKTELDIKRCFVAKLYKNIARNFNSNLAQNIGLNSGKHVVKVNFIIDKHGYATVLNVRAADKILEDEAIRVIQALPKMKPGTVNGKQSNIPYNIPIRFIVD